MRGGVGGVGAGARMIHPDPDAAHARMRGPTPHEISEPPPFPLTPFACSPGAAPHPLALLLYALVSTQLLPLQVSARHRHGVVPRACMRRRHRRASLKVGPAQHPRPAPPPPALPPLEAEEDPLSYQDLCRADTPWRYLALTEASQHRTAPHRPHAHAHSHAHSPPTASPAEESIFDERC